jgi:hypothetical protein
VNFLSDNAAPVVAAILDAIVQANEGFAVVIQCEVRWHRDLGKYVLDRCVDEAQEWHDKLFMARAASPR